MKEGNFYKRALDLKHYKIDTIPLYTKFKNKQNTFIIRADRLDREIDTDSDSSKTYLWKDLYG